MPHWRQRWRDEGECGPKSQFARYAFGYSDEKPHWSFWVILGVMTVIAVLAILGVI